MKFVLFNVIDILLMLVVKMEGKSVIKNFFGIVLIFFVKIEFKMIDDFYWFWEYLNFFLIIYKDYFVIMVNVLCVIKGD